MKRTHTIFIFAILLLFFSFSLVSAQKKTEKNDPYGNLDMMSVVVDQKAGSDKVIASVNLKNDEKLTAIVLPLKYGDGKTPITLDSVSFAKTRVADFALKHANIDQKAQKVLIPLISTLSAADVYLTKGDGEIARLYFTLKKGGGEKTVAIDTCFFPPSNVLQMVEGEEKAAKSIFPGFDNTKGKIKLLK
jgi:hypothetical protein